MTSSEDGSPNARRLRINLKTQRICLLIGACSIPLFVVGFVFMARFMPPLRPSDSAEAIAAIFRDRRVWIQTGMVLCQVALVLWLPWGVAVACRTRLVEKGLVPALTYVQLGATAVVTAQLEVTVTIWAVAAFRPNEMPPHVIQLLNDLGWFLFLFLFAPLTLWVASLAPAILQDSSEDPAYPHWVAYLSMWIALLLLPGAVLQYFKVGVFAWNGLVPFYIPLSAFFFWFGTITFYTHRSIGRELDDSGRSGQSAATL